ncbi:hypothetical protein Lfu02_00990 [Longispora fulva]|uniref:Protein kinase domain-containing protein n=1 Tax=Longispora fulva TaxID=619741 RepID=A0A8J7GE61_9ACTN|nr:hypothetical protein [Longispora fulva]MBG6136031.1 hypothetical protein [Longispora fulva]GIG55727.1 hypothetical protein Lfu02_00990 [Longispora fulva]
MAASLPASIAYQIGPISGSELIADRRGSQVFRVQRPDSAALAVKVSRTNPDPGAPNPDYARLLAAREAAVLAHGPAPAGYLHAAGATREATWIAVAWIDAPSLHRTFASARDADTPEGRRTALIAAAAAAGAVARLHTSGWIHRDLQSAHLLCGPTGASLVDFAFAQPPTGVRIEPVVPYRGGLVHLDAPELARALLDTGPAADVTMDPPAEVFSLAAVIRTCWTGVWMYDYPEDATMTARLSTIAASDRRPLSTQRPWAWPRLEALLTAGTEPEASARPTANEFADALTHAI